MFFKQHENDATTRDVSIHEGDGEIRTRVFFEGTSRLPAKWAIWELAPGVSEGSHVHDDDEALEEVYYFLEGSGVMWADGEDFLVGKGDAVLVPPGSDHGFRNTGSEPLKVLLMWGPPTGRPWASAR